MHLLATPYDSQQQGLSRFEIVTGSVVGCLLLAILCVLLETRSIEAEVRQAAESALSSTPFQWHAIEVEGQDVTITGAVDQHFDVRPILMDLRALAPVRNIDVRFESTSDDGLCQSRLDVFSAHAGIRFLPGTAELTDESKPGLERMAAVIRHCAPRVEVGAHTPPIGDALANQQLAERRAAAVVRELVRAGVVAEQLVAEGYGERQPEHYGAAGHADLDVDAGSERLSFRVRGRSA